MDFFTGTLAEAINTAKSPLRIFIIFYHDQYEKETKALVSQIFEQLQEEFVENAIAYELLEGTSDGDFFAQFYNPEKSPSLWFLLDGIVSSVIYEDFTMETFIERFTAAEEKLEEVIMNSVVISNGTEESDHVERVEVVENDEVRNAKTQEIRDLINERKRLKAIKDREDALENEKKRRETGKEYQKIREEKERLKRIEELKQRKKEEMEEKKYRDQLKEQIARDRETRKRELESSQNMVSSLTDSQSLNRSTNRDLSTARIRIRLLSGEILQHSFNSSDTLNDVKTFISQNTEVTEAYRFTTPLNTDFDLEDYSMTLYEANLAPSGTLIMTTDRVGINTTSDGILQKTTNIFWSATNYFYSTVSSLMGGSETKPPVTNSPPPVTGSSNTTKPTRKQGVHTLHTIKRNDDDTDAYNGNSTNQKK